MTGPTPYERASDAPNLPGSTADPVVPHAADAGFAAAATEAVAQLDSLAPFPPNWDGYGAPPFKAETIAAVRRFLRSLPPGAFVRTATGRLPAVVPLSSGAIQLEWHMEDRVLELEFETPSLIHYLKWCPQAGIEAEGTYPAGDERQSSRRIAWVLSGHDPD